MNDDLQIIKGSATAIPLPDESVQCIVTSPPYWGLRKYTGEQNLIWMPESRGPSDPFSCGAWHGGFGLEPTIEMYVAHTLVILRECWRVLRPDGVLFWNIGDSYHSDRGYGGDLKPSDLQSSNRGSLRGKDTFMPNRHRQVSLKPKDLCLIPERVAIAAQAAGWWVRSIIIWAKPNPMPESMTDRPTDTYENIIMLTKSERYFWDADAVREMSAEPDRIRSDRFGGNKGIEVNHSPGSISNGHASRNLRNVWTFPTQPYPEAHFATFPEELPRRCILAATSAKGACRQCGAPWDRIRRTVSGKSWHDHQEDDVRGNRSDDGLSGESFYDNWAVPKTIGWRPTCRCRAQRGHTVPCLVLDPFGGSGTTGKVAIELGRRAVLLDLAYQELQKKRTLELQRPLAL